MSKNETRQRIMDVAVSLFGQKGYSATTTREIAEQAKVTEVTLFRHFGTKENLLHEIILRLSPLSILDDDIDEKLQGALDQDLEFLARSYLDITIKQADVIRLAFIEAPQNPELARTIMQIPIRLHSHLTEYLQGLSEQGKIPQNNFAQIAQMFYSILFQQVLVSHSLGQQLVSIRSEDWLKTLVTLFTNGITHGDGHAGFGSLH